MSDTIMQQPALAPAPAAGNAQPSYPVNDHSSSMQPSPAHAPVTMQQSPAPTPSASPTATPPAQQTLPELQPVADAGVDEWVQCEDCEKWRRVFGGIDVNTLPDNWTCEQNTWDPLHNTCDAPSEEESQVDAEQAHLAQQQLIQQQQQAQAMQQSAELSRALEDVLFENKQPIAWPGMNSEYTSEAAKRRFYWKLWNVHNRTGEPFPRTKEPTPRPIDLYQLWRCAEVANGVDQIDMAEWRTLWYCSDVTEYPGIIDDYKEAFHQYLDAYNQAYPTINQKPPRNRIVENNGQGPSVRFKILWSPDEDEAVRQAVKAHGDGKWTNMFLDPRFERALMRHSTSEIRNRWQVLKSGQVDKQREIQMQRAMQAQQQQQQQQRQLVQQQQQLQRPPQGVPQQSVRSNATPLHSNVVQTTLNGIQLPLRTAPAAALEWAVPQNFLTNLPKPEPVRIEKPKKVKPKKKRKKRKDDSETETSESDISFSDNEDDFVRQKQDDEEEELERHILRDVNYNKYFDIHRCNIQLAPTYVLPIHDLFKYLTKIVQMTPASALELIVQMDDIDDLSKRRALLNQYIYNTYKLNAGIRQTVYHKAMVLDTVKHRHDQLEGYEAFAKKRQAELEAQAHHQNELRRQQQQQYQQQQIAQQGRQPQQQQQQYNQQLQHPNNLSHLPPEAIHKIEIWYQQAYHQLQRSVEYLDNEVAHGRQTRQVHDLAVQQMKQTLAQQLEEFKAAVMKEYANLQRNNQQQSASPQQAPVQTYTMGPAPTNYQTQPPPQQQPLKAEPVQQQQSYQAAQPHQAPVKTEASPAQSPSSAPAADGTSKLTLKMTPIRIRLQRHADGSGYTVKHVSGDSSSSPPAAPVQA